MPKAVGQHREDVVTDLHYAHSKNTLHGLLEREISEILRDCNRILADPSSIEGDWSSFLNAHPDALTAVYGEPISHLHREKYIDPGKGRVDYLVKRDMRYGYDILELKRYRHNVLDNHGELTSQAQKAIKQVMKYRNTLHKQESREKLLSRGFDFVSDVQVDLLGFNDGFEHGQERIQQKVSEYVIQNYGDDAKVLRLTTWDELLRILKAQGSTLFCARRAARLLIRRAITKATSTDYTCKDLESLWNAVIKQIKAYECGALIKQLSDWRSWLRETFDLLKPDCHLCADLCAVLTYEGAGDILAEGRWQHRVTYRVRDAVLRIQACGDRGNHYHRTQATHILGRVAKAIATAIAQGSVEECLWFAHLGRSMPTEVMRQADVFAIQQTRVSEMIGAGCYERIWAATNVLYMGAVHAAAYPEQLLDLVTEREDKDGLLMFNLEHASQDIGALATNISKKIRDPAPNEKRLDSWNRLVLQLIESRINN